MQWTSKKCTKKRHARAELLFWSLNLLYFWIRRCGRRRGRLSSLIFQTVANSDKVSPQQKKKQNKETKQNKKNNNKSVYSMLSTSWDPSKLLDFKLFDSSS